MDRAGGRGGADVVVAAHVGTCRVFDGVARLHLQGAAVGTQDIFADKDLRCRHHVGAAAGVDHVDGLARQGRAVIGFGVGDGFQCQVGLVDGAAGVVDVFDRVVVAVVAIVEGHARHLHHLVADAGVFVGKGKAAATDRVCAEQLRALRGHCCAQGTGGAIVGFAHVGGGQLQGGRGDHAVGAREAGGVTRQVVVAGIGATQGHVADGVAQILTHVLAVECTGAADAQDIVRDLTAHAQHHIRHGGGAVVDLAHARGVGGDGFGVHTQAPHKNRRTDKVAAHHGGVEVLDAVVADHGVAGTAQRRRLGAQVRLECGADRGAQPIAESELVARARAAERDDGVVVVVQVLRRGVISPATAVGGPDVGVANQQLVGRHDGVSAGRIADVVVV